MRLSEIVESRKPRIGVRDVNDRIRRIMPMDNVGRSEVQSAYEDIMSSAEFENGKMTVYRGMTVEQNWLTNLKPDENLGRYWAYERQGTFMGSWDKPNVIFTALVDPSNIDWTTTVAQWIAIGGEYEITLGGVQVVLKSIEILKGDPMDFSSLYGQSFWT